MSNDIKIGDLVFFIEWDLKNSKPKILEGRISGIQSEEQIFENFDGNARVKYNVMTKNWGKITDIGHVFKDRKDAYTHLASYINYLISDIKNAYSDFDVCVTRPV